MSRTSRTDSQIGTDFHRVEVLVHNALDDAGAVVVEKARAGLTKARYELVQSLGKEIKSSAEAGRGPVVSYQANLVEVIHDLLFSGLARDELVLNYLINLFLENIFWS